MAEPAKYHGGLVAFEGPTDLVSTQLRLLPTSSQIAVLPSVKEFLEPETPDEPFDARVFVRRVHNAVAKRREAALAFLKDSTPTHKRLVFMNGGTPSAQTVCIRAISRNVVDGDIAKAEAIFNDLVKGGVAGLDQHPVSVRGSFLNTSEQLPEDPITRAMRAADALDRETENLQPSSDIDLTIPPARPRSMSLPMYCFADTFGDTAPFYVFGRQYYEDSGRHEEVPTAVAQRDGPTPTLAITNFDELEKFSGEGFDSDGNPIPPALPRSPSCAGEVYEREDECSTPSPNPSAMLDVASGSDVFSIRSTESIFIEQASLVRMNSTTSTRRLKRSQSIGQLQRTNSRYRDTMMLLKPQEKSLAEMVTVGNLDSGRPVSVIGLIAEARRRENKDKIVEGAKVVEGAKTVYVKGARTNKVLPPPPAEAKTRKHIRTKTNYVDRGTDAQDDTEIPDNFEPVLPFHEDLVIHFKDDSPDPILEYMIKAFREGVYPVAPPPPAISSNTSVADGDVSAPRTPTSQSSESQTTLFTSATATNGEEYDPFSYESTTYAEKPLPPISQTMTGSALPTPAHTPPPTISEPEDKFHDFNAVQGQTAVAMQNSLRSVLNIYFPPKGRGYSQFNFPLLPEMEGLWKPIFRDSESGGGPRRENRRIDQILAIGAQRGVKKTFISGVTSQLERLGTKSNGVSRTGRLDFRYLIANAMQSFTAQPLANQTHDNPFTNSYILATLIIPHLETYFAAHSEVRFLLLDYPPDHLATILALQKLIGADMMKVAQVIDATAKEPHPFTHVRGNSLGRVSTRSDFASSSSSLQSKDSKSAASVSSRDGFAVSKANLLLTSNATPGEVATFVSTIWNILINVSKFYLPERGSRSDGRMKSGTSSPLSQMAMSPPISPPSSRGRKSNKTSGSIKAPAKPPSIAETIMSRRLRSRCGDKRSLLGDGGSIMTVDMEFESDLELEEKRLMPMFLKRSHERKGNSRKALKFLGLA